jgi:predicted nuclease of predicted toxin-antitoxin system
MSELRFFADESCDFVVIRELRLNGFDVLAVSEYMQRSVDSELLEQAYREKRVLLTEDKDFGWLVFASHADSAGVVLIRFPAGARSILAQSVLRLIQEYGDKLENAFVVIQPGQIRFSGRQ